MKKDNDIGFGILLILVGITFLLNTTGLIGWDIWIYIFRFWPVFLILGGIKLILSGSVVTELVANILSIVIFISIWVFSYLSYTTPQDTDTWFNTLPRMENNFLAEEESIELTEGEIESRVVEIVVGASEFSIEDDKDLEKNLSLSSKYYENNIWPSLSSEVRDGVLEIDFETEAPPSRMFWGGKFGTFDFVFGNTTIPTEMSVDLGAGKGEIDLSDTKLSTLTTTVGAGSLKVELEKDVIPTKFSLDVGAGEFVLSIPEEVGYILTYDLGVGEIQENGNDIANAIGKEGTYTSSNYESAEVKFEIDATVGVGSFSINNI